MKIKLLFGLIAIGLIGGFIAWRYVMKPVANTANLSTEIKKSSAELLNSLANADTMSLKILENKIIEVNGFVKNLEEDTYSVNIILGDTNSMNEIICQIDKRENLKNASQKYKGKIITVKGICTGYILDEMGLGSSIQLKNAIINN